MILQPPLVMMSFFKHLRRLVVKITQTSIFLMTSLYVDPPPHVIKCHHLVYPPLPFGGDVTCELK